MKVQELFEAQPQEFTMAVKFTYHNIAFVVADTVTAPVSSFTATAAKNMAVPPDPESAYCFWIMTFEKWPDKTQEDVIRDHLRKGDTPNEIYETFHDLLEMAGPENFTYCGKICLGKAMITGYYVEPTGVQQLPVVHIKNKTFIIMKNGKTKEIGQGKTLRPKEYYVS